jgi:hypothetical protein
MATEQKMVSVLGQQIETINYKLRMETGSVITSITGQQIETITYFLRVKTDSVIISMTVGRKSHTI